MSISSTLRVRVLELGPGTELDGSGRYTEAGTPSGYNWVTNTIEWTPDPAGRFESHQAAVAWMSYYELVAFASPVGAPHTMYARCWTIDPTAPDNTTRIRVSRSDFIDLDVSGTPGPMSAATISGWVQVLINQTFDDGNTAVKVLWDPFDGFEATNYHVGDELPIITTPWDGGEYQANAHGGNNPYIYGPWSDFYIRYPNSTSTVVNYVDWNGNNDETVTVPFGASKIGTGVNDGILWFLERDPTIHKYWEWYLSDNYGGPFPPIPYEIEPSQEPVYSRVTFNPVPGLTLDQLGGFQEYENLDVLGTWVCAGMWGEGGQATTGYTLYAWSDQMEQSGDIFAGVDSICRAAPDSRGLLRFIAVSDFDANVGPIYTQLWRWTGEQGANQIHLEQQLPTFDDDNDDYWHFIAPAPNLTSFVVSSPKDGGFVGGVFLPDEIMRWRVLDITGDDSIAWRTDAISWTPAPGMNLSNETTAFVWLDDSNVVCFTTSDTGSGTFGSLSPRTMYARQYAVSSGGTVSVVRDDSIALGTLGTPGNLTASCVASGVGPGTVHFDNPMNGAWPGPPTGSASFPATRTQVRGNVSYLGASSGGSTIVEVDSSDHIMAFSLPPGTYPITSGIRASMTFTEAATGPCTRTLEIEIARVSDNTVFGTYSQSASGDRSSVTVNVQVPTVTFTETMKVRTYATFGTGTGSGTIGGTGNTTTADGTSITTGSVLILQNFTHTLGGPNSEEATIRMKWSQLTGFSGLAVTNPSTVGVGSTGAHDNNRNIGGEPVPIGGTPGEWSDFFLTTGVGIIDPLHLENFPAQINFVRADAVDLDDPDAITRVAIPPGLRAVGEGVGVPGGGRVMLSDWAYPTDDPATHSHSIWLIDAHRGCVERPVDVIGMPADAPPGLRPIDLNGWDWFDALTEDYIVGIGWLSMDDDSPRVWILGPVRNTCVPPPEHIGIALDVDRRVRVGTKLPQLNRQSGSSGASGPSN